MPKADNSYEQYTGLQNHEPCATDSDGSSIETESLEEKGSRKGEEQAEEEKGGGKRACRRAKRRKIHNWGNVERTMYHASNRFSFVALSFEENVRIFQLQWYICWTLFKDTLRDHGAFFVEVHNCMWICESHECCSSSMIAVWTAARPPPTRRSGAAPLP